MPCSWMAIAAFVIDAVGYLFNKCKKRLDESEDKHSNGSGSGSETEENHKDHSGGSECGSETEENHEKKPMKNKKKGKAKSKSKKISVTQKPSQQGMSILSDNSSFYNCNFGENKVSMVQLLGDNQPQPTPAIVASGHSDTPSSPYQNILEWVPSTIETAHTLKDRAVIGGYDIDKSNLWIIRVELSGELILGKLNTKHQLAFAAYKRDDTYAEMNVEEFDVLCYKTPEARQKIRWIKSSKGQVPLNAFVAGWKTNAEKLYVGRARYDADNYPGYHTLCPGMIRPHLGALCITYNLVMHTISPYEVLCFEQDEYH